MITLAKLYYTEPWKQELQTTIVAQEQKEGRAVVLLEETIFYPTGGGQPHDLGTINGVPLVDVFEEGGKVYHVLARPLEGSSAHCILDWERRLDHMQQHSGQHLLSAIFADEYGYPTESFHLGEVHCSIDLAVENLSPEKRLGAETKANELIFQNLPLTTYTLAPEERNSKPLRKIPDLEGPLRVVEIQELDYSPCSGTHVTSTGQIQLLKILGSEKYKGMTRVYFICGGRALADYSRKHEVCTGLGALLSVPEGELEERTKLELERRRQLEKELEGVKQELLSFKAAAVVAEGNSPYFLDLPEASIEEGQQLARAVLNLASAVVVINLGDRLILAHNLPQGPHLGQLVKEQALPLGGRGGGSATGAQVYFPQAEGLEQFLTLLRNKI